MNIVFYINVGNMSPTKASKFIDKVMDVYIKTGKIDKSMTIQSENDK